MRKRFVKPVAVTALFVMVIGLLAAWIFVDREDPNVAFGSRVLLAQGMVAIAGSVAGATIGVRWSTERESGQTSARSQSAFLYPYLIGITGFVLCALVSPEVGLWPLAIWFLPGASLVGMFFANSPRFRA
jgi:hypothetical protein